MSFRDIILFMSRPQFWTGLALVLFTLGIAGPTAGFIDSNYALLAQLFGVVAQLLGFGAAQRQQAIVNDYSQKMELILYRQGIDKEEVETIRSQFK